MRQKIEIGFWGVRGSVASPNRSHLKYGGNTACVAIRYQKRWLVLDAGTGIRNLGILLAKRKEPITIFISHLHWDHIFGLPFFKPLHQKNRKIILAGPANTSHSFKSILAQVMRPPFFPIRPSRFQAKVRWLNLTAKPVGWDSVRIEPRKVLHHQGTLGFRLIFPQGRKIIYVTDQELKSSDKKFAKWIEGADLLIHDSQYDKKSYAKKKGWGHSSFEVVLAMAIQAKVKHYCLFHHDPEAGDQLLEKRLILCRKDAKAKGSSLKCSLAKEGSTILV